MEEYGIEQDKTGRLVYYDNVENLSVALPRAMELVDFAYLREPAAPNFDEMAAESFANPLGTPLLREIAKGRSNVTILVSDATRAVATARVLPFIVREIELAGVPLSRVKIIVAIGVHREATPAEMREIAGAYHGRIHVENHDPYSGEKLAVLGRTSYGNCAEVNKTVHESDLRICVGKVEAHEFAGFSGGRKSVLPGIASEACIAYNHRPEMILDPRATAGVLEGNPIHLDMLETARMLGIDFCVSLVQNASGQPIGVFTGDLEQSHLAGVRFLRGIFGMEIKKTASIYLVTPGYPLNIDLYQSLKALIAMMPIAKDGDTIVFYSKCTEGTNSEDMIVPFRQETSLDGILKYTAANYRIQMDHALLLCKLYQKGVNIVACSPGVSDDVLATMKMTPARDLDHAVNIACTRHGDKPRITIIPMPQRLVLG